MSPQSIKTKLLATSIFAASACGTFALFGCVPTIARMTVPTPQVLLSQLQNFSHQSSFSGLPSPASGVSSISELPYSVGDLPSLSVKRTQAFLYVNTAR